MGILRNQNLPETLPAKQGTCRWHLGSGGVLWGEYRQHSVVIGCMRDAQAKLGLILYFLSHFMF